MDARIACALSLIDEDPTIGCEGLAAAVNLSASRFRHLFRATTSMPLNAYLRSYRMAKARHLMCDTFLSVKQVATASGFQDPCHFVRRFRLVFGLPPAAYRRAHTVEAQSSSCVKRRPGSYQLESDVLPTVLRDGAEGGGFLPVLVEEKPRLGGTDAATQNHA